jgi:hypothetical protein
MIKRACLLLLITASLGGAQSRADQPNADREGVRRAVLDYVEGFYEGDSTKLVRSVRPEVFKYGFWIPRGSTSYSGEQMKWPEFHAYANRVKERKNFAPASAPKDVVIFDVLDQTASAKLTAFWGVDYLLLAKHDGKWMISTFSGRHRREHSKKGDSNQQPTRPRHFVTSSR